MRAPGTARPAEYGFVSRERERYAPSAQRQASTRRGRSEDAPQRLPDPYLLAPRPDARPDPAPLHWKPVRTGRSRGRCQASRRVLGCLRVASPPGATTRAGSPRCGCRRGAVVERSWSGGGAVAAAIPGGCQGEVCSRGHQSWWSSAPVLSRSDIWRSDREPAEGWLGRPVSLGQVVVAILLALSRRPLYVCPVSARTGLSWPVLLCPVSVRLVFRLVFRLSFRLVSRFISCSGSALWCSALGSADSVLCVSSVTGCVRSILRGVFRAPCVFAARLWLVRELAVFD